MKSARALRSALLFVASLMLCASAQAQLFRAYLASDGNDANPCSLPQPCRLLPAALTAVADGGEIWMLDSANYNGATVVVSKSVSILAVPGAVGSVVAIGGPAFSITAGGLTVALRNLVIVPFPSSGATEGVTMTGASNVTIENSLLANLPGQGAVHVIGAGTVEIANTTIRNGGGYAVWLQDGGSANISSTKMLNNSGGGVTADSTTASPTTVTVSDSIISGGFDGAVALANGAGAAASIFLTRCTIQKITNIALDIVAGGGSTALIAVSSSMVTNNTSGWNITGAGATIRTLGNNHLTDNGASTGSLTTSALQ